MLQRSIAKAHASEAPNLEVGFLAVDQDLSVVVEFDQKYRATVGNDGAAFDYIFKRGQFETEAPLSWYVGAGAWLNGMMILVCVFR